MKDCEENCLHCPISDTYVKLTDMYLQILLYILVAQCNLFFSEHAMAAVLFAW